MKFDGAAFKKLEGLNMGILKFFPIFLYKFVQFERLPIKLNWMLSVIFICCHTIMPCRTLCHSDLVADPHCLKFHRRFFCSFFSQLLEVRHRCHLSILYYLHCGNSLTPKKPSNFPSTMGKLSKLSRKRKFKSTAARKDKAAADAAVAADATAAAAADAASRAAAATIVPAAPAGSGSVAASNRVNSRRSYAAAVANGPTVAVNVTAETTSVVAASVASPSSAATKSSKKIKLSAAVTFPADMADPTSNALLPPAPDLPTTALKSPKKHDDLAAAVGHGATDASVPSKSRYPSRCNAGRKTTTAVGASSHFVK